MLRFSPFRRNDELLGLLEDGSVRENLWPYILASFLSCQISLTTGLSQGYSTILLSQLQQPDSPIYIDDERASWIASLGTICRPIGALMNIYVLDMLGRKRTMQAMLIVMTLSWVLACFSDGISMIYTSRILMSFVLGMSDSVAIYLNEISKATQRGTLLSLFELSIAIGTLVVYVLGHTFSWRLVAILLAFHSTLVFIFMFFIPESSVWYLANGRKKEAVESLVWFRGLSVIAGIENEIRALENRFKLVETKKNYNYLFTNSQLRNRLFMFVLFIIIEQFLGYTILMYYTDNFYASLGTAYNVGVLTIIQGVLMTIGSFTVLMTIHRFKRKSLLVSAALGSGISMSVAAFSYVTTGTGETITLVGILAYVLFLKMGVTSVPQLIIAESFPTKVRAAAACTISTISYTVSFIVIKSYPFANSVLGVEGLLIYLACIPYVLLFYVLAFFSETKDRTLIEMEDDT